jgi:predicted  nucleic acid-binding Zn-ribbon protein
MVECLRGGAGSSASSNGVTSTQLDARLASLSAGYEASLQEALAAYKVELQGTITGLSDQITQQRTDADTNNQRLQNSIEALQASVSGQSVSVQSLTAALSTVTSSMDSMVTTVGGLSTSVSTLDAAVATLSAQAPQVISQVTQLQTDVGDLQTHMASAQADIVTLQTSVASAASASDLSALSHMVNSLSTNLTALSNTVTNLSSSLTALTNTVATQITSLQTQIAANATAIQNAITSLRRYINVKDYGAVGDGTTDDTQAFISCINAAVTLAASSSTIFVPKGTYRITAKLTCWRFFNGAGRRNVRFIGEGRGVTHITFEPSTENSVLFEHTENFACADMNVSVVQATGSTNQWGIAFSTPLNAQSAFTRIENVALRGGWKYSFFRRFTLWDHYSGIDSRNSRCHFMFAISASHDTPLADGGVGWNGGATGWFHNQATFTSILCEGGEAGIIGGVMGFNLVDLTCQGIAGHGANNTILPANAAGTGIWIQGRNASDQARGNVIGSYYTEVTERPIYLENCAPITLTHAFMQGEFAPDIPVAPAIELNAASMNIMAVTIRGRFTEWVKASTGSTALVFLTNGGGWTVSKFTSDSSSNIVNMTSVGESNLYRLTRANGTATENLDVFNTGSRNYRVRISGSTNGVSTDAVYLIEAGTTLTRILAEDHSTTPADFSASNGARGLRLLITNNMFRVSRVQTFACDVYIHVQKLTYSTL